MLLASHRQSSSSTVDGNFASSDTNEQWKADGDEHRSLTHCQLSRFRLNYEFLPCRNRLRDITRTSRTHRNAVLPPDLLPSCLLRVLSECFPLLITPVWVVASSVKLPNCSLGRTLACSHGCVMQPHLVWPGALTFHRRARSAMLEGRQLLFSFDLYLKRKFRDDSAVFYGRLLSARQSPPCLFFAENGGEETKTSLCWQCTTYGRSSRSQHSRFLST